MRRPAGCRWGGGIWREWRDIRAAAALAKKHRRDVRLGARCAAAICCCTSFSAAYVPTTNSLAPCRVARAAGGRARRRRRDRMVPAPPQLDSGALRGDSRNTGTSAQGAGRGKGTLKEQGSQGSWAFIALRNFRRARVERVHAEWQRLEAAAAAAAEAAAERERAFRSRPHAVCIRHRRLLTQHEYQKVILSITFTSCISAAGVPGMHDVKHCI